MAKKRKKAAKKTSSKRRKGARRTGRKANRTSSKSGGRGRTSSKPWTTSEVQKLDELAVAHTPVATIARKLGRSPKSVRDEAEMQGIALPSTRRLNPLSTR